MPSREMLEYFDVTESWDTRDHFKLTVPLVGNLNVANDCGCGAGSDVEYLRNKGFQVHAYDIEKEAIKRCET